MVVLHQRITEGRYSTKATDAIHKPISPQAALETMLQPQTGKSSVSAALLASTGGGATILNQCKSYHHSTT